MFKLHKHLKKLLIIIYFFQYYEMSYGLNVEMHKQVSLIIFNFLLGWFITSKLC